MGRTIHQPYWEPTWPGVQPASYESWPRCHCGHKVMEHNHHFGRTCKIVVVGEPYCLAYWPKTEPVQDWRRTKHVYQEEPDDDRPAACGECGRWYQIYPHKVGCTSSFLV